MNFLPAYLNPRSLRGFILLAASVVSLVVFIGVYLVVHDLYQRTIKEDARNVSELIAEQTFNSMYQVMRKGWSRADLDIFLEGLREPFNNTPYSVTIYRGPRVDAEFGGIAQPALDDLGQQALLLGKASRHEDGYQIRYLYPLLARKECLRCHETVKPGQALGLIDVRQNLLPVLERARSAFLDTLILIVPVTLFLALISAILIHRRINHSLNFVRNQVDSIQRVDDLTRLRLETARTPGFTEVAAIAKEVNKLAEKLRTFAVDKDLLEFEIRLLERFVITSEVVSDWREYVQQLLVEINQVMEIYALFSIFKQDEDEYELELFWLAPPSAATSQALEQVIRRAIQSNQRLGEAVVAHTHQQVANPDLPPIEVSVEMLEVQVKSLLLDAPKIGGIVGIGVHSDLTRNETRMLVIESVLSTLLNVVGSVKAISRYTKDLEHYATRDPLTGLYNQRLFWELLEYEVGRAGRHHHKFAVLMMDMDNFKSINDSFGHTVGDRFLQAASKSIGDCLRQGDIFARYGGDEFVAILPEIDDALPYTAARRILEATDQVLLETEDGQDIKATLSIGVATYPDHAKNAKDLFLFADNMMYKAKAEGKHRFAVPSEQDVVDGFRQIGEKSNLVKRAMEERWVVPFFQPIARVDDDRIYAHEILSRIRLPDGTLLGAGDFIEIAEQLGIIHRLDYIAMEKAFEKARAENYEGLLFVNISPKALVLSEFFQTVKRLVVDAGLTPGNIVFELTERDTVRNMSLLEAFVQRLRDEGFKFAIDDFGSGFSSFHYLKRLPIDYLKIEGDFVANMHRDAKDRAFVRSMAMLARELNIMTIAEFVESEEVKQEVREALVDLVQGYHIGRPTSELIH
ncbi:putative bifunctional diguanylate cyclase/phosphodiesterase [Magnetovirga frankeli]|uniref:putative bifunctional diguanylate cyclase/phosphodiesterase n=1 Tax=Magnetovirga frankeli TaxID=947516 RepID=UPI003D32F984